MEKDLSPTGWYCKACGRVIFHNFRNGATTLVEGCICLDTNVAITHWVSVTDGPLNYLPIGTI